MNNAEIGSESCADIEHNVNVSAPPPNHRRSRRGIEAEMTEYPPPIPSLARTGNYLSDMPWVMNRYYTDDGRLIIREEKVGHTESFQVHRSNGRLVVNLVPIVEESDELLQLGEEECAVNRFFREEINGGWDEGISSDPTAEESNSRCYTYNKNLGVNTSGGFAAVAFMPPVPI